MAQMTPERMAYTAKEVAKILGMSDSNVYRMVQLGLLRAVPVGKKAIRIPKQAVEELLTGRAADQADSQEEGGDALHDD